MGLEDTEEVRIEEVEGLEVVVDATCVLAYYVLIVAVNVWVEI